MKNMVDNFRPEQKEVIIDRTQERKPEQPEQNIFEDFNKFAQEHNSEEVFIWIKKNVKEEDMRMGLWGTYIAEIVRIQTINQIREEYICLRKL